MHAVMAAAVPQSLAGPAVGLDSQAAARKPFRDGPYKSGKLSALLDVKAALASGAGKAAAIRVSAPGDRCGVQ